ncbi:MAG: SDR family NAD(P)-dependent oxidoreductase [Planctomycetes bacterium]|nr:SDR family NAD(P)-dependent oxidoreductase [Planctomycetota bacterium]
MRELEDHISVVTGAGSGIGKAIALALAARGSSLVLVGRRTAPLEEVAATARGSGAQARHYPADLSVEREVRELAAAIDRDFGRLDVLVHSAAIIRPGAVADASVEDFDLHYRTNVLAPYLLTQTLLPLLRRQRGQVVFINSSVAQAARANISQYAATKHALKAIADSLRDEVNRDGIRVLSVYPGRTATPTQERLFADEGRAYQPDRLLQAEDVAAMVVSAVSLPRTAEVTEIHIRPMMKFE